GGRRERSGQHDALRMRRSKAGMNAAVLLVESVEGIAAHLQDLLVGREWHGSSFGVRCVPTLPGPNRRGNGVAGRASSDAAFGPAARHTVCSVLGSCR